MALHQLASQSGEVRSVGKPNFFAVRLSLTFCCCCFSALKFNSTMNDIEKCAIDQHMSDLINDLKITAKVFFVFLEIEGVITTDEREIIENGVLNAERLLNVFNLLKWKQNGWSKIQEFYSQNHSATAEKLRTTASLMSQMSSTLTVSKRCEPQKSLLDKFSAELSKYYRHSQFANISTLWGDPKCVKDFWIPLTAEDKTKMFVKGEQLDHLRLLTVLAENVDANLAVVIGDPGSGKTTLFKKIAYDWACTYGSNADENQFSLVLAVPLRSVGKFNDFLESTIDYFLENLRLRKKLKIEEKDKSELIQIVSDLDEKLLIILDGLDEYDNYDDSLFKSIFARKFDRSRPPTHKSAQLPPAYYKLIITSRLYACKQINMEIPSLKFQLCSVDEEYLGKFAELYCQTPHGIANVTSYMQRHSGLVIKVPLILTFVCFLADADEVEIPTNLTLLYDRLIKEMLRREGKSDKFDDIVRSTGQLAYSGRNTSDTLIRGLLDRHKKSDTFDDIRERLEKQGCPEKFEELICSIPQLAYSGSNNFQFEFGEETLKEFNVTEESFVCGFLLDKYDLDPQGRKVFEFLHRSIQDFFAALYLYQLFTENVAAERNQMDLSRISGEFGRFFFGICCKEDRLNEVVDRLTYSNPANSGSSETVDTMECSYNYITHLGPLITDCSDTEQFNCGVMLQSHTRIDFEQQLTKEWNQSVSVGSLTASTSFAAGLNLKPIQVDSVNGDSYDDYLILDANDPRIARLAVLTTCSLDVLLGKLDSIDNLFCTFGEEFSGLLECSVEALSLPMRNVSIDLQPTSIPAFQVTCLLSYKPSATPSDLKVFRFSFDSDQLLKLLQPFGQFDTDLLTIGDMKIDKVSGVVFVCLNVSVDTDVSQATLMCSLIKLSLTLCNTAI